MPALRLLPARTLGVSIAVPAADAYAFMADPRRLPEWATGLGTTPTPLPDGAWRVETPAGPMRVVFAPANGFGVVDHVVTPLTGGDPVADVPLRVVPNGPPDVKRAKISEQEKSATEAWIKEQCPCKSGSKYHFHRHTIIALYKLL